MLDEGNNARIFASSKENLLMVENPIPIDFTMSRRKAAAKAQKRSTTSINIG